MSTTSPNPKAGGGRKPASRKAPRKNKKANPDSIASRQKAAVALDLRLKGLTYEAIAQQAGYKSKQAAFDAVSRAIDRITREPAEKVRNLDLERLDGMWQKNYENAKEGDHLAVNACMKILERKARLLGIDAPVRTELSGPNGQPLQTQDVPAASDEEWAKAKAELGKKK